MKGAVPKMHADELETDAAFVRRLLTAQFPHWASLPIEPVPSGGTDNALYRLGDAMVVRLPRRERTATTLAKERRWLPTLGPNLPIAVPEPVADGMPTGDYPWRWSVYRWLEGEDATTQPLTDVHQAALELAAFITALESIDPAGGPPPGEHNFFRGGPLAARDAAVRASIVALEPELDIAAVAAGWDEALRAPTWARPVSEIPHATSWWPGSCFLETPVSVSERRFPSTTRPGLGAAAGRCHRR